MVQINYNYAEHCINYLIAIVFLTNFFEYKTTMKTPVRNCDRKIMFSIKNIFDKFNFLMESFERRTFSQPEKTLAI